MNSVKAILLAAGASVRMGTPKQLLPWKEQTLIEHQAKTLLSAGCDVFVVLGAYADKILPVIETLQVTIIHNKLWNKGMGNSLSYGVEKILKADPRTTGLMVSLVDQPLLNKSHFHKILGHFQPSTRQIIVSRSSDGWTGPPVLFDAFYFKELMKLDGDHGAKPIIEKYRSYLTFADLGSVLEDADTREAYTKLIGIANHQS